MPKVLIEVDQKRPADATPERALAMYREGKIKQTEIALLWGISKARVSKLIAQARKREEPRMCANCFHHRDNHCSCRESSDVVLTPNKCPDWLTIKRS